MPDRPSTPGVRLARRVPAVARLGGGLLATGLALAGCTAPDAALPPGPATASTTASTTTSTSTRTAARPTADGTAPAPAPAPTATGSPASPGATTDAGVAPDALSTAPRSGAAGAAGELAAVTVAEGPDADTVTFTFAGGVVPGYAVRYVDAVRRGEDDVVPLEGDAALEITFVVAAPGAGGATADGVVTNQSYAFESVRQVVLVENLAGTVRFGIGLAAQTPFRVVATPGTLTVELARG